jgi:FKBP-type peptidyl-prolyl cis-trans isomerase
MHGPRPPSVLAIAVLSAALSAGCATAALPPPSPYVGQPDSITYAPELQIDLARMTRLPSGVYYRVTEEGSGDSAVARKTVTIDYVVAMPDARKVDSSNDSGKPMTFRVGGNQVIKGVDQGVVGMKLGERRLLVIPPELAYGDQGIPNRGVPPNSTLIFEIVLTRIR